MGTPVDPLGWAIIATSVASAGSSIAGGIQQRNALKSQAKSAEYEAQLAELRGVQAAGDRREELNAALSTINTVRAGRNLTLDDATGRAIRADRRENAKRAENRDVLDEMLGAVKLRNEADGYRRAAPYALIGGFGRAAGSIAQAGRDYKSFAG